MGGNFRKNKKKAAMARGSVDKAQNQLMDRMNKKLNELESAVETKYNISYNSDAVSSYNGTDATTRADQIVPIDIGVNQGTSDNERIGDQVTFKHIDLNYRINLPQVRATEYSMDTTSVRVLLFWDSQPSTIAATGSINVSPVSWHTLLQMPNLDANQTNIQKTQVILSTKDWDQRKRFQIVYDKIHTFTSNDPQYNLGPRATTNSVSFSKNYKGQKLRYVNGGTVVQNRKLYFAYISDSGIATAAPAALIARRPVINYNLRVLYDDI